MFDFQNTQKVHLVLILSLPGLLIVLKDIQHCTGTRMYCVLRVLHVKDAGGAVSVDTISLKGPELPGFLFHASGVLGPPAELTSSVLLMINNPHRLAWSWDGHYLSYPQQTPTFSLSDLLHQSCLMLQLQPLVILHLSYTNPSSVLRFAADRLTNPLNLAADCGLVSSCG